VERFSEHLPSILHMPREERAPVAEMGTHPRLDFTAIELKDCNLLLPSDVKGTLLSSSLARPQLNE